LHPLLDNFVAAFYAAAAACLSHFIIATRFVLSQGLGSITGIVAIAALRLSPDSTCSTFD
jgi:hypothetical protein